MKNYILSLFVIVLVAGACKDKITDHFTANIPIYMDYETFRSSFNYTAPVEINEVSGIFLHDHYLLLIEPLQGIHVLDNGDPSNPTNIGFMDLPGVSGMDIKGNYLIVDSYVDLIVLDISDMNNPVELSRTIDQFRSHSMANYNYEYRAEPIDYAKGVVVGWEIGETSVEVTDDYYSNNQNISFDAAIGINESFNTGVNISGSITKFSIIGDYLYVMNDNLLKPFNISNALNVQAESVIAIPFNVETLFDYNDHIFMGTTTGMLIYNTTDPSRPEQVSVVSHWQSCDPVVVQGDYAYVTLRSGTFCFGTLNQLDVIDVSDYSNPEIIDSFEMSNPHGLGVDEDLLFVCDGDDGLKIFDNSNPNIVGDVLLAHFPNIKAIDVIPFNNTAMMFSEDGLRQYNYSDINNVFELSYIPFN